MEKCIWSYFILRHYFQLTNNFRFQIICKRKGQWRTIFKKQFYPKWYDINNAKLLTKNKYYFKCEDSNIFIDYCPKDINNNNMTDFSKLEYERFGVGYRNEKGRSYSKVIEYSELFFFNWL